MGQGTATRISKYASCEPEQSAQDKLGPLKYKGTNFSAHCGHRTEANSGEIIERKRPLCTVFVCTSTFQREVYI